MNFQNFREKFQKVTVEHYPNNVPPRSLVSVCIQTYQQRSFIRECLDGILMQQTDFDFEILIGEDFSRDGTREICIEYADRYPSKVRLLLHRRENNIEIAGIPTGRFAFVYNLFTANGKYIALCEGDDYWTDPLKLQKQIDFLEANLDFSLCAHNASVLEGDTGKIINVRPDFKSAREVSVTSLISRNPFLTASLVFRKEVIENLPSWFSKIAFGDYGLLFLCAVKGRVVCLPDVMSVYRLHAGGIHSNLHVSKRGMKKVIENHLYFFKIVDEELLTELSQRRKVRKRVISLHRKLEKFYAKENNSIGVLKTKANIAMLRVLHKIKSRLEPL